MTDSPLESFFVAVGDIMLGDSAICVGFGFHSRHPLDASPALAAVAPLLRRGDVVFGNLECLLTRAGRGATRFRADQMRGDPEYARILRSVGFTALSVANNHAMQHGIEGFKETVESLERAGIACVGLRGEDGWSATPVIQRNEGGLTIGMLGYSWRPRQYDLATPPYAEGDVHAVVEDVRRLAATVDVVVVSLHWGEEFLASPSTAEVDAAHRIVDAGAALIVGHHPHVVRPVERYGRGVICYSLGNFVTDMLWQPALRTGGILECRLRRAGLLEPKVSSTRVDDSYAPIAGTRAIALHEGPVAGVSETEYVKAVAKSVSRQRRAAYLYALRHVHRYPAKVLAELIGTTVRNKLAALVSRAAPRRAKTSVGAIRRAVAGPAQPLSILHVVAPARFGGLESVVQELAAGHTRDGHEVRVALVLSPGDQPHPLAIALRAAGVTAVPIEIGDRDYRGERRAIQALCRQHRPDIVHTHGYRSDVVDGVVARSEGIPVVSTCHGFIDSAWRGRAHQWLQRRALRRFDAVVAVSQTIQRRLINAGVDPGRIHLVANAAATVEQLLSREEARRRLELPNGPVIGWVGRLSSEKGPDVALESFARLGRPDARLLFIGSGRDAQQLHARAVALGVSERVIWRGAVPNAGSLFPAFDVFLLSSRSEGTPMALLEAMSAGVPIVATRVGGVPDVIDSSSAHLAESGDVDAIATALRDVLRDPDAARSRSERARALLDERFAVEPWLSAYESIYRRVLDPG